MKNQKKLKRISAIALFSLGLILGLALFGGTVWADMEAFFYFGSFKTAEESFHTLSCPLLITADEVGRVTASFTNQHSKAIEPLLRVEIGKPGVEAARKVEMRPYIDPNSTQQVEWRISAEDKVFGNVIVVKAYQFEAFKTPSREGTCGTMVVNLPFMTGNQIFITGAIASILMLVAGVLLWNRSEHPMRPNTAHIFFAMLWLGGITLGGVILGYLGLWAPGLLLFLVMILLIAKTLMFAVSANWNTESVPSAA